jgi:hypothetical protein
MEPYEFLLDLTPKGAPAVRVTCSQNDVKRPFVAHLKYLGKDFAVPDGSRAEIRVRKPDNNIYIGNCTCEQCYVYYQTALQMTCVAGDCVAEISIIDTDGNQIGSWNFTIHVEVDPIADVKKSESVISWIETAREEINNTATYATEAKNASAEAKTSEANAKASETAAKASETNAASSATEAQGYADSALTAATNAAGYAGEAEYRLMINPETGHMALAHYTKEA